MEIIEYPKNDKKNNKINSFFSDGITLEGNANFEGSARIDCKLYGKITCTGTVFAGRYSKMQGELEVKSFVCEGDLKGSVNASGNIYVSASGVLAGEIKTPGFTIEHGGFFEGVCQIVNPKMKNKNRTRKKPKNPISVLDEA